MLIYFIYKLIRFEKYFHKLIFNVLNGKTISTKHNNLELSTASCFHDCMTE
jgi:hypothetical protein